MSCIFPLIRRIFQRIHFIFNPNIRLIQRDCWNCFGHTAWPRTLRLWRKTSGSRIKAASSSVLLEKQASSCCKICWSATSSPRSHSLEGGSSRLRAKNMTTWWVTSYCSQTCYLTSTAVRGKNKKKSLSLFMIPAGSRGGGLWEAWWLRCCLPEPRCCLLLSGNNQSQSWGCKPVVN